MRGPVRVRVTWCQGYRNGRGHITHPILWMVTEDDGYERFFDTKRDALEWMAQCSAAVRFAAIADAA